MHIRLKRAIAVGLLAIWSNADTAMAGDDLPEGHAAPPVEIFTTREEWGTYEQWVKAFTNEIIQMPFVRAYAYAEAIDRYCFPEKSYTQDVGPSIRQAVAFQDTLKPGILASAERDAADHLRGEYLACAPAMKFVERTVVQAPELVGKFIQLQMHLDDVKAGAAKACAIGAQMRSPPKLCEGYLPD